MVMATLYNRATASQRRVLRIVEGAVKNVADCHPELKLTPRVCRSIAKRAAGTLTAQWPDVLAAKRPSERADETPGASVGAPTSHRSRGSERGRGQLYNPRPQLRFLWNRFAGEVALAKRTGRTERAEAFIDVLRAIDALIGEPKNKKVLGD